MKNNAIEKQIIKIYNMVYKEVFNKSNVNMLSKGSRIDIQQSLIKIQNNEKYDEFARKFSLALAKKGLTRQRGIWRKYFQAAKRNNIIALNQTYNSFEMEILSKAVKHNFEMIKSIPERMMEILNHKYTSTLIEEVAKGTTSRGSFQRLLASHGIKQAKLIARTETAKLQTEITRNRALDVGSVAYIWLSSKDRRTRPSHREMNGVIVFWRSENEKPLLDEMRGDAGEFPNCRCDAQPIVDIEDLTENSYKVYDYRIHKIINMNRKNLIESLQKGELI